MKKFVFILLALLTVACQAKLVDNFESYDISSSTDVRNVASPPWTAITNTGQADIFDDGTGNQVLAYGWASGLRGVFNDNIDPVEDDTTDAVLFFNVYVDAEQVNHSFGLSDKSGDSSTSFGYGDFEVQISFLNGTDGDGKVNFFVRNAGDSLSTEIDIQTWYNIWAVIDQVNDTYSVYLSTGEPVWKNASLVAYNASFRNAEAGSVGDLVSLLGLGNYAPDEQSVWIDNIEMGDLLRNPYDQQVSQAANGNVVEVTLKWTPSIDMDGIYDINPAIAEEYVFVGTADSDQYYVGKLGDPGTTLSDSEFLLYLDYDTTYNWTIVEALEGYTQSLSMADTIADANTIDPNNIIGETWTFETLPSSAVITEEPVNIRVFESESEASFTVAFNTVKNPVVAVDWYKDDAKLTAGGDISMIFTDTVGDGTATLTITNPSLDDEGKYYCILNTSSDASVTSDDVQSITCLLTIKKLLSEYTFDNAGDPLADTGEFAAEVGSMRDAAQVKTVSLDDPNEMLATVVEPTIVVGIQGNALYLDGDQYVDLDTEGYPKAGTLNTIGDVRGGIYEKQGFGRGLDEGSVLCWAKLESGNIMVGNGNIVGGNHFAVTLSDDKSARIIVRDDTWKYLGEASGSYSYMDDYSMHDGQWHMVAATWSGNTARVYINGEQVAQNTQNIPDVFIPWELSNLIGASRNGQPNRHILGANSFLIGAIDELRVYNYEISGADIAQEYALLNEVGVTPCMNHNFVGSEYNLDNTAASYCIVNLVDFASLASNWLANGF